MFDVRCTDAVKIIFRDAECVFRCRFLDAPNLVFRKDYCLKGFQFDSLSDVLAQLPESLDDLFTPTAFKICIQWLLFQVLLDRVLPGKVSRS